MSTSLLNPYTPYEEISDEVLIDEYLNPIKYKKRSLYAIMAYRCRYNLVIKDILFSVVTNKEALEEVEMGIIKHAWLPALFILQYSTDAIKKDLAEAISKWPLEEQSLFLGYIKNEKNYMKFFI